MTTVVCIKSVSVQASQPRDQLEEKFSEKSSLKEEATNQRKNVASVNEKWRYIANMIHV